MAAVRQRDRRSCVSALSRSISALPGADSFTRRLDPGRETRRLIELEALGHQVSLQPAA